MVRTDFLWCVKYLANGDLRIFRCLSFQEMGVKVFLITVLCKISLDFQTCLFVFSFAIIMVEMCTRHHPYHELDFLGPHDIVQLVGRLINYDKRVTLVVCFL